MANGHRALSLVFEPPSDLANEPLPTPRVPIDTTIGPAVVGAVEALVQMLIDVEGGTPLRAETRTLGGDRLAVVVEHLLTHHGEIDGWRDLAQREGMRSLHERYGTDLRQQLGTDVSGAAIDAALSELCAQVITAAGQVAAIERVFRAN